MDNRWNTHIKPYLKEIERWAKSGDSGKDIAAKLNIGYSTFRKYASEKAELVDILRNSRNYVKQVTENALMNSQKKSNLNHSLETPLMTYVKDSSKRPDQNGTHRKAFERAKKKIYATQDTCGICGKPIDFKVKYPHPLSACVDHIIPVAKGGHPSDMSNLQLAHWTCNRQKSDKLVEPVGSSQAKIMSNRILPQSMDWSKYKAKQ